MKIHIYEEPNARKYTDNLRDRVVSDLLVGPAGIWGTVEPFDRRTAQMTKDLVDGRFWGTLALLDGRNPAYGQCISISGREKMWENGKESRAWAKEKHYSRLNDILNVIVNQALHPPDKSSWPGAYRGHTILYEELIAKEDSLFKEAVTPEFERRLQNGRFWECLSHAQSGVMGPHYHHLEEVLANHTEALDPSGVRLMRRDTTMITLLPLSDNALLSYADVMAKFDKTLGPKLEPLMMPYVKAALSWNNEYECPIFDGREKREDSHMTGPRMLSYTQMLEKPIAKKMLSRQRGRELVANTIASLSEMHCEGAQAEFILGIMKCIPKRKDFMRTLISHVRKRGRDPADEFRERLEKIDVNLEKHL